MASELSHTSMDMTIALLGSLFLQPFPVGHLKFLLASMVYCDCSVFCQFDVVWLRHALCRKFVVYGLPFSPPYFCFMLCLLLTINSVF